MEAMQQKAGRLVVAFIEDGDDFKIGDWVCELHLIVQQVEK